jgi:hypothetical protein
VCHIITSYFTRNGFINIFFISFFFFYSTIHSEKSVQTLGDDLVLTEDVTTPLTTFATPLLTTATELLRAANTVLRESTTVIGMADMPTVTDAASPSISVGNDYDTNDGFYTTVSDEFESSTLSMTYAERETEYTTLIITVDMPEGTDDARPSLSVENDYGESELTQNLSDILTMAEFTTGPENVRIKQFLN